MKRFSKFITEAETEYQKWLKDYESSKEYKVVTGLRAKGIEPMRIGLPGQEFIPITNALKQSNGDVKKAIDILVKRVVDDEKQRPKSRRMHPNLKLEAVTKAPLNSNEGRLRLFSNAFVHFKDEIHSAVGGDSKKPIYCVYSYNQQGSENWRGSSGSHDVTMFVEHPTEADKMMVFNRIYHWSSSRALWNKMKVETLPKAEARSRWTTLSNQQIVGSRLDVAQIRYANGQATVISKSTKI
jgi:hypothetical protein